MIKSIYSDYLNGEDMRKPNRLKMINTLHDMKTASYLLERSSGLDLENNSHMTLPELVKSPMPVQDIQKTNGYSFKPAINIRMSA
jgi:hypothetical protein